MSTMMWVEGVKLAILYGALYLLWHIRDDVNKMLALKELETGDSADDFNGDWE